jgi:hypothetical protein
VIVWLHSVIRRQRRRLLLVLAVAALTTSVLAAHSALADGHMGDGMAMCVAVADSALLAMGAALATRLHTGSWRLRWVPFRGRPAWRPAARPIPRARAGPAVLQVVRR